MEQSEVLIHRSPERWAFYSAAPPLAWSDQLGCWITANRDVILSILKNEKVHSQEETADAESCSDSASTDMPVRSSSFSL